MATNNYISTGGGSPSGGGSGIPSGGFSVPILGKGHLTANGFVQNYQRPFEQELARISQLAATDPAAAREQLAQAVNKFVQDSNDLLQRVHPMGRSQVQTVINQAFSTPGLVQTVNTLAQQTGVPNVGSFPTRTLLDLAPIFAQMIAKRPNATAPGAPPTTGETDASGAPVGDNTGGSVQVPNLPATGGNKTSIFDRVFGGLGNGDGKLGAEDLLDIILTGGAVGLEYANQKGQNDAINKAAEEQRKAVEYAADLQKKASDDALALQRDTFNQNRQDALPWLQSGQKWLGQYNRLMGMDAFEAQQQNPQAQPTMSQVSQPQQPQQPAFDPQQLQAIVSRYRRT